MTSVIENTRLATVIIEPAIVARTLAGALFLWPDPQHPAGRLQLQRPGVKAK